MKATSPNWHDVIDERSLEMDRLIAEKIRLDPSMFQVVLNNLRRWTSKPEPAAATLEWKQFIDSHSQEEVLDFICSWTEESRRMRQSSPFCGILTEQERLAIFKKYESFRI
ncbi:MAG: hypothetical protein SFY92_00440 [Verrucomicrobiae bacterium]|nr:hypothetical protein [Verrucomicrobiae bacterium]